MSGRNSEFYQLYRMALAANIRKYRKLRDLTPDDMASMLGMSKRNYYKLEQVGPNQVIPQADMLPLIASIFGITLDELFGLAAPAAALTPDEGLMLQYFRQMPSDTQVALAKIIRSVFVTKMPPAKVEKLAEFLMYTR